VEKVILFEGMKRSKVRGLKIKVMKTFKEFDRYYKYKIIF